MDIYFDQETLGFYPAELQSVYEAGAGWPAAMVLLTELQKSTYWNQSPPAGQELSADGGGNPVFTNIAPTLASAKLNKQEAIEGEFNSRAVADGFEMQYPEAARLAALVESASPPTTESTRFWSNVPIAQAAITFVEGIGDVATIQAYDEVNTPAWSV